MSRIDLSRLTFFLSSIAMIIVVSFAAGLYSYHTNNFAFQLAQSSWVDIRSFFGLPGKNPAEQSLGEQNAVQKNAVELYGIWRQHLQPARGQGEGVTVNKRPGDGAKILVVGAFDDENQARLLNRDGSVVAKWSLNFFEHFPDQAARSCEIEGPLFVDVHGALLTPGGELVANYEYCGAVKVDHCGTVLWKLEEATHHSVIRAQAGGYWILGREAWETAGQRDRFPPFSAVAETKNILEDFLLRVSDEGEIIERFSIPRLLYDSGLEALMTATGDNFDVNGSARNELVHTNKIAELSEEFSGSFPLFSAGDLALSMRELNLVLVVDGATKRVKWHQTGPWLRQHDPEFRSDGRISIFNNNAYRTAYEGGYTGSDDTLVTNILTVDPATGETEIIYGQRPGQGMLSIIRGEHQLLDGGGMVITEFDAGRVLEVDSEGNLVWEYVNRYDADFVGEITNAALYDADYFTVDWSDCE